MINSSGRRQCCLSTIPEATTAPFACRLAPAARPSRACRPPTRGTRFSRVCASLASTEHHRVLVGELSGRIMRPSPARGTRRPAVDVADVAATALGHLGDERLGHSGVHSARLSASYGAAFARAPRHGRDRGRPGRTGHERSAATARPGACGAGAPAGPANAGGPNAGSRSASGSRTGYSDCRATRTPATTRTASRSGARSGRHRGLRPAARSRRRSAGTRRTSDKSAQKGLHRSDADHDRS
jgi:hypothetical protein